MMLVGITGATGGLGRHLLRQLLAQGYHVRALVRQIPTPEAQPLPDSVEWYQGNLEDPQSLAGFVAGLAVCFHLAAQVSTASKERYWAVNVAGTRHLCQTLLAYNRPCRLIHCSSIAARRVRFWNRSLYTEYSRSKAAADRLIRGYGRRLDWTIIYPGLIFGPGCENLLKTATQLVQRGLPFLVAGGERLAPLIAAEDLSRLFVQAATNPIARWRELVAVRGQALGVHDIFRLIAQRLNQPLDVPILPRFPLLCLAAVWEGLHRLLRRPGLPPIHKRLIDVLSLQFTEDVSPATLDLGWAPKRSFAQDFDQLWEQAQLPPA